MNRRAILAGLLVVVLVALVVVLATGGGDQQAQAVKGTPFLGESGITRSVAAIKADQRYLDAHPEIEVRRNRQLAAEEAAREAANEEASHEGEASGEEESAGEEGEAAQAEGDQAAQAEGDPAAALERARELGERAAEEADIREKPEPPGEERMPPKQEAPGLRLQRAGSAAIGPKQAVNPSTSFLGAQSNESGFIPPDSMGAVGPSQVLVFVNGVLKIFDKQGNQIGSNISDSAFWAPVRNGSEPTDPGVEYDRLSQRWILSGINTEESDNRIMLAVSDGPTITSSSDFTFFAFNQADPAPAASPRFADYPQLGVDENAIYIGVNEFAAPPATGFAGTTLYVIRKSSVLGAGPMFVTAFRNLIAGGQGPVSPQPATDMVPGIGSGYVVGPDASFFSRLDIRRINDPGGNPTMSANTVTVPTTFAPTPFSVPAQGTSGGLDALDDRLFEAMIGRDPAGTPTLWTAHNILVNSSGAASPSGNRAAARWYQLGNLDTTPSLIQSGTVFDPAASNPRQFWIPSIAMNGQGQASINMSTAGTTHQVGIASSGRLFGDPAGKTDAFQVTQNPGGTYNLGSSTPRRWGDYSQTVVDPTDNQTFWTFQEYTSAQNVWGVRVIQLKAPPPATPASAAPNTILTGQSSVPVMITGTSLNGSGFFDPGPDTGGPGFPNHIDASVSGGVVVNSVTYTDPNHITLDLDTTAATPGAQSVTVTNPDGQPASCTPLVVGTDTDAPSAPNPQGTTPGSPANDTNPKVFGSNGECGSTVQLYTDDTCTNLAATGSAIAFASPGIPVTVPANMATTFWTTATDVSNNTSPCSAASATYVEDSTPPTVSVDSGPTGTTPDQTPTFTFSGNDAVGPLAFECSIDTGTPSFRACSGPGESDTPGSPLADGSHTFRVQATDAAGNSSTATRAFSVQTPAQPVPPETTITKGPKKTRKTRPKFKFRSSDPAATFQCKLDKHQFARCASSFKTPKLLPGKHVLRVRAVGTGGTDASPAVRKFRILPPG